MSASIFDYTEYRTFIRDRSKERKGCTQRAIARRLDQSSAYVSMVVGGERKIAIGEARKWSSAMFLEPDEAAYFEALVRMEHAPTEDMRRAARMQIQATREYERARTDSGDDVRKIYTDITRLAISEVTTLAGFRPEPEWIAARMPGVDLDRIRAELDTLMSSGVLVQQPDGSWRQAEGLRATGSEVSQPDLARQVRQLHLELLDRAGQSLQTDPASARHFVAATFTMRSADLPALKRALHQMEIDAIHPFREQPDADQVVALGLFVIPLSRPVGEGDGGPRS